MLTKRIIILLTYKNGILFRTKNFCPDYRYTDEFISNTLVDEIVIVDISDDLSSTNRIKFYQVISKIAKNCFVPITAGGKITNIVDVKNLQNHGADKIIINSAIYKNSKLIDEIVDKYGSQFVIGGLDVKKSNNQYYHYIDNGKKKININIKEYLTNYKKLGVGEILINSIDQDGSLTGFDIEICKFIKDNCDKPILASGGCGNWQQARDVILASNIDGICITNIFHFTEKSICSLKKFLKNNSINVRI
jgi:cyclase